MSKEHTNNSNSYAEVEEGKRPKFKRGNPGRPKGTPNKFTELKEAFLEAFEELGGIEGLVEWAKKNPRTQGMFYQMISKMLPSNVDVTGSMDINITLSDKFLPELGSRVKENGKKPK